MSPVQFSICIPVYEDRGLLRETLASVRAQTHTGWELIVVEDGSREPARDVVEAFAAAGPQQVTYLAQDKNRGLPYTRDAALAQASQEWIALLDADDVWKSDHLAAIAETVKREAGCEFIFSGYRTFAMSPDEVGDGAVTFVPTPAQLADLRSALFFRKLMLQPSAFAFRASVLKRTGPWSRGVERLPVFLAGNINFGEDLNFLLRCLQADVRMAWTGRVTSGYRRHAGSMTVQRQLGPLYRAAYFDLHGLLRDLPRGEQRKAIAHYQVNAARQLKAEGRHRPEIAWFYWRAWCWHPLRADRLAQALRAKLRLG